MPPVASKISAVCWSQSGTIDKSVAVCCTLDHCLGGFGKCLSFLLNVSHHNSCQLHFFPVTKWSVDQLLQVSVSVFIFQEIHECVCVHSDQQVLHSIGTLWNHEEDVSGDLCYSMRELLTGRQGFTLRVRISLWSLNSVSWVLSVRSEFTRKASLQRW